MTIKNLTATLLLLLLCSCSNRPMTKHEGPEGFFGINFEDNLDNKEVIPLSTVASDVEYVQLETNDDCMVAPVVDYFINDEFIFISNRDHILQFSRDGSFIKKIGNPGRGPGEIDLIRIMSVIWDKKLIAVQLNAFRKLLFFSFDGKLVKTLDFEQHIQRIKVLPDGKYVTCDDGSSGRNRYTFCLLDEMMDTISTIKNYINWVYTSNIMIGIGFPSFKPFYMSDDRTFFKTMYNDTVFTVSNNEIKPYYHINLGKYKLPSELRPERLGPENIDKFRSVASDHFFVTAFEANNEIFVSALNFEGEESGYLLFNRETLSGKLLVDDNNVSAGFVNDWDGGPDFWPVGSVNDNQVYMPIDIITLQKELENIENNTKEVQSPRRNEQLVSMISEADATDNPILMIVTLK